MPATPSGELLDLARDTYHHPAIRTPWAELPRPSPEAVADALDATGTRDTPGPAKARAASQGPGGGNASQPLTNNNNNALTVSPPFYMLAHGHCYVGGVEVPRPAATEQRLASKNAL